MASSLGDKMSSLLYSPLLGFTFGRAVKSPGVPVLFRSIQVRCSAHQCHLFVQKDAYANRSCFNNLLWVSLESRLESASVYLSHPPNIRQNHPSHHPPCATTSRASSAKSSPPGQAILRIIPPAQNHPLNHPPCPEPSSESSPLPRTILRIIPPAQNHPQNHPPCPESSPESSPLPKTIP